MSNQPKVILSLFYSQQNQQMRPKDNEAFYIQQLDPEYLDATMKINFTAPSKILNYPTFQLSTTIIDEQTPVYTLDLEGDLQTEANFAFSITQEMNKQIAALGITLEYNVLKIQRQSKFQLYIESATEQTFYFKSDDVKLCKVIGAVPGLIYKSTHDLIPVETTMNIISDQVQMATTKKQCDFIDFSRKMYILYARQLTIKCFNLKQATLFVNGCKEYVVVKTSYDFQSSSFCSVDNNFPLEIFTQSLIDGLAFTFYDELGNQIDLENEPYTLTMSVSKSEHKKILEEMADQAFQQYYTQQEQQRQEAVQKHQEQEAMKQQAIMQKKNEQEAQQLKLQEELGRRQYQQQLQEQNQQFQIEQQRLLLEQLKQHEEKRQYYIREKDAIEKQRHEEIIAQFLALKQQQIESEIEKENQRIQFLKMRSEQADLKMKADKDELELKFQNDLKAVKQQADVQSKQTIEFIKQLCEMIEQVKFQHKDDQNAQKNIQQATQQKLTQLQSDLERTDNTSVQNTSNIQKVIEQLQKLSTSGEKIEFLQSQITAQKDLLKQLSEEKDAAVQAAYITMSNKLESIVEEKNQQKMRLQQLEQLQKQNEEFKEQQLQTNHIMQIQNQDLQRQTDQMRQNNNNVIIQELNNQIVQAEQVQQRMSVLNNTTKQLTGKEIEGVPEQILESQGLIKQVYEQLKNAEQFKKVLKVSDVQPLIDQLKQLTTFQNSKTDEVSVNVTSSIQDPEIKTQIESILKMDNSNQMSGLTQNQLTTPQLKTGLPPRAPKAAEEQDTIISLQSQQSQQAQSNQGSELNMDDLKFSKSGLKM